MRAAQQEHWACLKAGQWLKATNDDGAFSGQPAPDVGSPEPGAGREAFALVGGDEHAAVLLSDVERVGGGVCGDGQRTNRSRGLPASPAVGRALHRTVRPDGERGTGGPGEDPRRDSGRTEGPASVTAALDPARGGDEQRARVCGVDRDREDIIGGLRELLPKRPSSLDASRRPDATS